LLSKDYCEDAIELANVFLDTNPNAKGFRKEILNLRMLANNLQGNTDQVKNDSIKILEIDKDYFLKSGDTKVYSFYQ
jgi:hypothetical protein